MFLKLLLAMTIIPIVELVILIDPHQLVAKMAGPSRALLFTIGTVLVTGIIGAKLSKSQGFKLIKEAQAQLARGLLPDQQLLEGVLVIAGSVMLLTPGYITDLTGLCLLLPVTRKLMGQWLSRRLQQQHQKGRLQVYVYHSGTGSEGHSTFRRAPNENIIDVEPINDRSSETRR